MGENSYKKPISQNSIHHPAAIVTVLMRIRAHPPAFQYLKYFSKVVDIVIEMPIILGRERNKA